VSIRIEFTPWGTFFAEKDRAVIDTWLHRVGKASEEAFRNGMSKHFPPASAPGDWPANRTGNLKASISSEVGGDEVTVGTGMPYSGFLRNGTSRMARRKMSDNALQEGVKNAGPVGRWVRWTKS
jgi:hypothetical protein